MSSTIESLYPIFIKWMPFHIPILILMYSFIVMKLLNYFELIEISFELDLHQQKHRIMNILVLIVCYLFIMVCVIWMYKKVVFIKMAVLKGSGAISREKLQQHVKMNTTIQLEKLQNDPNFLKWKKQKLQKQEHEKTQPKVVYEAIESSSSDEQIERINEHRLATSKKIF